MTESTSEYKKRIEEIKQSIENEPYMAKMREDIAEGISKTGIRQATVEEQFQAVLDETTGKDVISMPEIIVARGGATTLGERLDGEHAEITTQLDEKASQSEVSQLSNTIDNFQLAQLNGIAFAESKHQHDWRIGVILAGQIYYPPNETYPVVDKRIFTANLINNTGEVIISLNDYSTYRYAVQFYNASDTWVSDTGWMTTDYTIPANRYFRLVIATLTDSTVVTNVKGAIYDSLSMKQEFKDYELLALNALSTDTKGRDFELPSNRINFIQDNLLEVSLEVSGSNKKYSYIWEIGTIGAGVLILAKDQVFSNSEKRIVTSSLQNTNTATKVSLNSSRFRFVVHFYDLSGNWLSDTGWMTDEYTIPQNSYFRIVVARQSGEVAISNAYGDIFKSVSVRELQTDAAEMAKRQEFDDLITVSAHRGINNIAPENTLVSFEMAKDAGFAYIEFDVRFTSDGVPVILHDVTINRTARNADGSAISETINIADITFEQALSYDFGRWISTDFIGTKIPTLDETLDLCRKLNLRPYIHVNITNQPQIEIIYNAVKRKGLKRKSIWIMDGTMPATHLLNLDDKAVIGVSGVASNAFVDSIVAVKNAWNNENIFMDTAYTTLTQSIVDYAHANDLEIGVYTLNDDSYIIGAVDYGCISLTVNNTNVKQLLETSYYSG